MQARVTAGIREYMDRDWGLFERTHSWRGVAESIRIGAELRRHVASLHPDWPTAEARRSDFEFHVRMRRLLDRADRARSR